MNFRCAAAPMYVEMVKAMGARPVTTGFAEVYTGLAQGALDMLEAPLPTMWASKFYEQAKFVALTGHMIALGSGDHERRPTSRALPPDMQKILLEEASNAAEYMSKLKLEEEAEMVKQYESRRRHGDPRRRQGSVPQGDRGRLRQIRGLDAGHSRQGARPDH